NAGLVHHVEHAGQALVGFAHQITHCAAVLAEVEHGGGGAPVAQLVDQARQGHVVAGTQATIVVDQILGHNKQGNTLHAGRRIRQTSQHQVHDVLGELMVTAG